MNNIQVQQNLIPLLDKEFNGEIIKTISARELHQFLEVRTKFNDWVKRRFEEYGYVENADYVATQNWDATGTQIISIDYFITIDVAKELSMVEKNDKGREVRKYFIECEKKLKENIKPMTQLEIAKLTLDKLIEQEVKQRELENRMTKLEAKSQITVDDYFTISGYCALKSIKGVSLNSANILGRKCSKLSRELEYDIGKIHSQQYGVINTYHIDILEEIFNNYLDKKEKEI